MHWSSNPSSEALDALDEGQFGGAFQFHACRQGGAHHFSQRTHVVVGHPSEHVPLLGRQNGRIVHQRLDLLGDISLGRVW